jgi:hypothetical protein
MTVEETSTAFSDLVAVLAHAAAHERGGRSARPSAKVVVNALLQAEKAAKQQHLTYPLNSLLGDWRLCFTAPRKAHLRGGVALGKGLYVPQIAKAQISFSTQSPNSAQSSSQVEINNSVQCGPLLFKLTGPTRYLGKKNLLAFDFTYMQLCLFGRAVYSGEFRGGKATATNFYHQSIAKLPFFAFFLMTDDFIAARGRGGGLALWVKSA